MAARFFSTFLVLSATFSLLTHSLASNVLLSGDYLRSSQALVEGNYRLSMRSDCNLVLYDLSTAIWSSDTHEIGGNCYLTMRRDGNLVIYNSSNKVLWTSGTTQPGERNYVLVLQKDRNVVIYGPGVWETRTNHGGPANVPICSHSTEPVVITGNKISMVTDTEK